MDASVKLVTEWANLHREELEASWERAKQAASPTRSTRCRKVEYVSVTSVRVLGHYKLRLGFSEHLENQPIETRDPRHAAQPTQSGRQISLM